MTKSIFEQNGGVCRQVGDFKIPNLVLPPEEASVTLGKWGMLHKDYLINHKKVLFTILLTQADCINNVPRLKSRLVRCMTLS